MTFFIGRCVPVFLAAMIVAPIALACDFQLEKTATAFQSLNRQIVTRTAEDLEHYTPENISGVTAQLHALLTAYIASALATRSVSPEILAAHLRTIQGEYGFDHPVTNTPFVLQADDVWFSAVLLYRGGAGAPDSKAILQIYKPQGERYETVAERTDDFDGHTLFLQAVPAPRENELWLLTHGTRMGDNHNRLKVVLYSFDGSRLLPLWEKAGIPHGQVEVFQEGIRLTYRAERAETVPERQILQEEFRFTADGLEPMTPSTFVNDGKGQDFQVRVRPLL